MNLSRVNLNLLVALDALLTERHVTRAGKKLHISQSAMSNVLKQLRETFKDELFVRGAASRMIPTARALELAGPVRAVLEKATEVFAQGESFNPATAERTFTIGMSDYAEFIILPGLVKQVLKHAPNVKLEIKHLNYWREEDVAAIESDKLDLAIGIYHQIPPRLLQMQLLTDYAICVGAAKNPLLKKPPTLAEFARFKRLVILFFESASATLSDQILKEHGYQPNTAVIVPHNLPAIFILPDTDLVALMLGRVAHQLMKGLALKCQPAPFDNPLAIVSQVWHPKTEHDVGQIWLRNLVQKVAAEIKEVDYLCKF